MVIDRFARSCYRIPGFLLYSLFQSMRLARIVKRHPDDPRPAHEHLLKFIEGVHKLMGIEVTVQGELPSEHKSKKCKLENNKHKIDVRK